MSEMIFVGICGSLRQKSRNMGLLRKAAEVMPAGASVKIAQVGHLPFYNADIEKPDSVKELVELSLRAEGFIFACPEYNYSLAPALKNAIDWLSREPDLRPFYGKPAAVLGAAGGMGSVRSQNHLRQVCVYLNLLLLDKPEVFANAFSKEFDADGNVADAALEDNVKKLMASLVDWANVLRRGRSSGA